MNLVALNMSFDSNDTDVSVLRPIATAEELRQKARTRTTGMNSSRRSSLLQDRLLRSASKMKVLTTTDDHNNNNNNNNNNVGTASDNGMMIVNSYSNGNDNSIDDAGGINNVTNNNNNMMNNMDLAHLNESEISNHPHLPVHTKIAHELLEAHKLHVDQVMETLKVEMDALKDFELIMLEQGPQRPTEEEVVEYFESLGLCLEQRKKAGSIMQKKMDRISQG